MIKNSRTTALKLHYKFSYKVIAVSFFALLTTSQSAISIDDEIQFSGKRTVKFGADSGTLASAASLEELITLPVVNKAIPAGAIDSSVSVLDTALSLADSGIVRRKSFFSSPTSDLTWDDLPTVRILSLDGGGVRGIAEARFVQQLTERTGKTVPEMFHLVAGTSAGGILAGAYTLPDGQGDPKRSPPKYSSDYIFDMMMKRTKNLFVKGWSLWGLLGPRYKSESVEKFMNEYFGDATFDKTTTDALVTTFDISANRPKIFKSWDTHEIFYTKDILESTSAAPTYFAPRHIYPAGMSSETHLGYVLTDGGTCANNPTASAVAAARKLYPDAKRYEIVSLGTGNSIRPLHYETMKNAGLIGWGRHLIDIFMSGQSTHTDYLLDTLFTPEEYSRWNPVLAAENAALDNASDSNLRDLVQAEDDLITSRRGEFDRLAASLTKAKSDLIPVYSVKKY